MPSTQGSVTTRVSPADHGTAHDQDPGQKTPEDFFDVGLQVLGERGFPALTAVTLCAQLNVTRGSFYHHFTGFDAYVEGLVRYWEQRWTEDMIALSESFDADGPHFVEELLLATALPHGAEAALRAWASIDPVVGAAQRRVDTRRRAYAVRSMRRRGLTDELAETYTDLALAALVGIQMLYHSDSNSCAHQVLDALQSDIAHASHR